MIGSRHTKPQDCSLIKWIIPANEAFMAGERKPAMPNAPQSDTVKYPDIHVQLTGKDGNAFFILGRCQGAARKAGIPDDQIKAFMAEASAGDYDHLLATCMRWFECH
jgi:hypothetical protein